MDPYYGQNSNMSSGWRARDFNNQNQQTRPSSYNQYNRWDSRRNSNISVESNENQNAQRRFQPNFGRGNNDNSKRYAFNSGNRGRGTFNSEQSSRGRGQYVLSNTVNANYAIPSTSSGDTCNTYYQPNYQHNFQPKYQPRINYSTPRYSVQSSSHRQFPNTSYRLQAPLTIGQQLQSSTATGSTSKQSILPAICSLQSLENQTLPSKTNKKNASVTPEIKLKSTTFVDRSGALSSLDMLISGVSPIKVPGKFVVNAIVGLSACGKSSTWNEILKQPVFKTRPMFTSDYCDNSKKQAQIPPGQDKNGLAGASGQMSGNSVCPPNEENSEERVFNFENGSVQVLLCERTLGRWFVFDTQPLLCSNNCPLLDQQTKKPFKTSNRQNQNLSSISLESAPNPAASSTPKKEAETKCAQKSKQHSTKSTPKCHSKNVSFCSSGSQISNKNSTLFSLQTLTFLFVCSDNVVIILDPSSSLEQIFSLLLTAIMIVRYPTSTLYFYIPESFLVNHLNPQEVLQSIQKRLIKHFRSKANFGLVTCAEELSILLNQPKICRLSALIDYSSEHSWLTSAHRYWNDIDIPGNLLYQYCSEHDKISFPDQEELRGEIDFSFELSDCLLKKDMRSNKSHAGKSKNTAKSSKSSIIVEDCPNADEPEKTEMENETHADGNSLMNSKTKRGGFGRGRARFWKGSSRGSGNSK